MKKDIHPQYQDIIFSCACGASFLAGSTIQKEFKTEICSACHPFYTGKQKLIDSSGRVDKFLAKMKKAQAVAEKNVKKVKKGSEEAVIEETVEETKPTATEEAETTATTAKKKPAKKAKTTKKKS